MSGLPSGTGIQRAMRLLATSTPDNRNNVRILFYGQSISKQGWSRIVADHLKSSFPCANIEIENRSIGGFSAPRLKWSAEFDLEFHGDCNRIDLICPESPEAMDVWVDGERPSQIPGCYAFTRPNDEDHVDWIHNPHATDWPWETPLIFGPQAPAAPPVEDWLLTITAIDRTGEKPVYSFELRGSATGPDGAGTTDELVTSHSGRIVLPPEVWFLRQAEELTGTLLEVGHEIRFTTRFFGADRVDSAGVTTVAQGLSNGPHMVRLRSRRPESRSLVLQMRVYRPPFDRYQPPCKIQCDDLELPENQRPYVAEPREEDS